MQIRRLSSPSPILSSFSYTNRLANINNNFHYNFSIEICSVWFKPILCHDCEKIGKLWTSAYFECQNLDNNTNISQKIEFMIYVCYLEGVIYPKNSYESPEIS